MRRPLTRDAAATVGVLFATLLTGCGEGGVVDTRDSEQVADEARRYMNGLAEQVGTDPEVTQDEIALCDPADDFSGDLLFYGIQVTTRPGVRERVRGEIADRYRRDGWSVRERGADDVVFERDNVTMAVGYNSDNTLASIGGNGGCVR